MRQSRLDVLWVKLSLIFDTCQFTPTSPQVNILPLGRVGVTPEPFMPFCFVHSSFSSAGMVRCSISIAFNCLQQMYHITVMGKSVKDRGGVRLISGKHFRSTTTPNGRPSASRRFITNPWLFKPHSPFLQRSK